MNNLIKKPNKKIRLLCKKYHIKLTVKRGNKRVYKKSSLLIKQIKKIVRKKSKNKSRFGHSGCNKQKSSFGKNKLIIKKLHKLCKLYKVKIAKHTPEYLRKHCLKKAKMILKKNKQRKSRFGNIFGDNPEAKQQQLQLQAQIEEKKLKTALELKKQEAQLELDLSTKKRQTELSLKREEEKHQLELKRAAAAAELKAALDRKNAGLDQCPPCPLCDSVKHDTEQVKFGKKRKKSTLKF
jgi:hypothetical protein